MSGEERGDPHIHVDAKAIRDAAAERDTLASTFGLAGDLPSTVKTGCGVEVPYAMVSSRPDRVTCLACREHAAREHMRFAEQVERIGGMPGSPLAPAEVTAAAGHHRDLGRRFSGGDEDGGDS